MNNINNNYKHITLDDNKRHFVFGDIHGRYETFLSLLQKIEYDEDTDVLYSVGDLIDRGPNSVAVVNFFNDNENCHAVRGNHEQMLVNFREWERVWMHPPNGGPATLQSMIEHDKDINWLTAFCRSLPIVLDVGDDETGFRLIHAEYPCHYSNDMLMEELESLDTVEAGESDFLWGRSNITHALTNANAMRPTTHAMEFHPNWGNRKVFSGHTPTKNVIKMGNAHWIDTFGSRTMTCVEPTLDVGSSVHSITTSVDVIV